MRPDMSTAHLDLFPVMEKVYLECILRPNEVRRQHLWMRSPASISQDGGDS